MQTFTTCFLVLFLRCVFLFTLAAQQRPPFVVQWNVPQDWLVADLLYKQLVGPEEILKIQPSSHHQHFHVNNRSQILTKTSNLRALRGKSLPLYISSKRDPYERVFTVHIHVPDTTIDCVSSYYKAQIQSDTPVDTEIKFSTPISVNKLPRDYRNKKIHFSSMNNIGRSAFLVVNSSNNTNLAKIFVHRRIRRADIGTHIFYLAAFGPDQKQITSCKVTIEIKASVPPPPKFDHTVYRATHTTVHPQMNVIRVQATSSKGSVVYRLEPESSPFDIAPFAGDVFSRKGLPVGRYVFDVIAKDSFGQESKTSVTVLVEGFPVGTQLKKKSQRARRQLSGDIIWTVKENMEPRVLDKKIPLYPGEKIFGAPIVKDFFTINADGTIEMTQPLNYEKTKELMTTIQIDGRKRTRMQTIHLLVDDVDEPPAFVNGPSPFLAVVPLKRPIGFHVYRFEARDENGDGDSNVIYKLVNTEPSGTFTLDEDGVLRTAQREYEAGKTFRVFVQAIDKTPTDNSTKQDSEVAKLEILAGDRPPQFLRQHYEVAIPEDNMVDYSVVDVRAQKFKSIDQSRSKGPVTYSLFHANSATREASSWFRIEPSTGVVHLKRLLDYDDTSLPKLHKLTVVAKEDGSESTVPLDISIEDINDNAPMFTRPLYSAQVKEDIRLEHVILKVEAEDKDSGENARITYAVDNDNFTINDKGEISAKVRLDADQFKERFFIYRFNVTATDHGKPPLSTSATVHIRTENTNDEKPTFLPTDQYTAYVAEDAEGGTPVVQIQARDPDRDQVEYAFLDENGREKQETTLFHIDKDTGLIKLRPGVQAADLLKDKSPYNLTVLARDDGSCCNYESETHTTTATVLIGIEDVNNNKPEFRDCSKYAEMARIEEGMYKKDPPTIIKVEATDEDSSSNGEIVYSLYYAQTESRKPFVIDKLTGVLTPSPHVVFDREQRPREDVTVKATDRGDRPLIGFCQFSVEVVDVNDNAPQFDRASYETSVSRNEILGTSVLTVFAYDLDAPHNARVTYKLESDPIAGPEFKDDVTFFEMKKENSGEITLIKPIPKNVQKTKFIFNVVANDNGIPESLTSTVQVTIKVHEKQQSAPRWQTSPDCRDIVTVVENAEMNKVLLKCYALAGDGSKSSIVYKLSAGGPNRARKADSKFRQFNKIEDGREWVEVAIMEPLDYEQSHNYTLTLTATDVNSHVSSSKSFVVVVDDVNDVVPQFTVDLFTGTVDEELTPSEYFQKNGIKAITTVKADDNDSPGPQSEVHYRILDMPDAEGSRLFRIDEITGEIFPNAKFDRETRDMYILTVEARDNMPSDLPGVRGPNKDNVKVQIVIGDVNDNAPYFDEVRYQGRVAENADLGHDIIIIKAHDLDKHSNLRYDLSSAHGGRIPFGVRTDSGAIFVKEPLDFEQETVYSLKLHVSDGKNNKSTDVYIYVDDINDNAPVFEQGTYTTTVQEEDPFVPKTLFTVKATDADMDEKSRRIVYRLEGQGAGEFFQIGRETGEISLMKILDRDPPNGVPTWKFIVQAVDDDGNGLIGYADVQVNIKDINDNAPVFPDGLFGYVEENREPHSSDGVYFMDVRATDFDDPTTDNAKMEYSIIRNKEIDGKPVFRIDPHSGKIFAMMSLDREKLDRYDIGVMAVDKGFPPRPGYGNVTIKVLDKNDNEPMFERSLYEADVLETAAVGSPVISVSAVDPDDEAIDNVFSYQLVKDSKYFYMTTDRDSSKSYVGVLRVKQPLDYEDELQKDGYDLSVRVSDGRHEAFSRVHLRLIDRNDHAPDISGPSEVELAEDVAIGHVVAHYDVTDRDHVDDNHARY